MHDDSRMPERDNAHALLGARETNDTPIMNSPATSTAAAAVEPWKQGGHRTSQPARHQAGGRYWAASGGVPRAHGRSGQLPASCRTSGPTARHRARPGAVPGAAEDSGEYAHGPAVADCARRAGGAPGPVSRQMGSYS